VPCPIRWPIMFLLLAAPGCGSAFKLGSATVQSGTRSKGIVYYVGGAGPLGNVGFLSVPLGLEDGGFEGYTELVPWQGITTAMDQIDLSGNRAKGIELGEQIRRASYRYYHTPISIIALSAGTGIATFALESLPEDVRVKNVVYLGCSMSSRYDLTRAMKRVDGRLYNIYSSSDNILAHVVPLTGTVDRSDSSNGIAGLYGFGLPWSRGEDMLTQYRKVHNIPYQSYFVEAGYDGGHMSSVEREFIARYVTPLILGKRGDLSALATCVADEAPKPKRSARVRRDDD